MLQFHHGLTVNSIDSYKCVILVYFNDFLTYGIASSEWQREIYSTYRGEGQVIIRHGYVEALS